jgi:hypothetical protein
MIPSEEQSKGDCRWLGSPSLFPVRPNEQRTDATSSPENVIIRETCQVTPTSTRLSDTNLYEVGRAPMLCSPAPSGAENAAPSGRIKRVHFSSFSRS